MNPDSPEGKTLDTNTVEKSLKSWEKPVIMRLAVDQTAGANNYDDDMDFKGAS